MAFLHPPLDAANPRAIYEQRSILIDAALR
jgi:hypothetical protein